MGYPALAEEGTISLVDEMHNQKAVSHALFAFYLGTPKAGADRQPELTFGYYDSWKYKGSLKWNKVVEEYMYLVRLDDIKING